MIATGNLTVNLTSRSPQSAEAYLADARRHRDGARSAWAKLRSRVHSIEGVFGLPVAAQLERDVEQAWEPSDEAASLAIEAAEKFRDDRDFLAERNRELNELLDQAVAETKARFAKARRPLPEWVAQHEDTPF